MMLPKATHVLVFAACHLIAHASAAETSSCQARYASVSKACCSATGASSRRLSEQPDMYVCDMPSTCSAACAAVLPAFYAKCKDVLDLTNSDTLVPMIKKCASALTGSSYTHLKLRQCAYNYRSSFTSLAAAEKNCSASPTCPGVMSSNGCNSTYIKSLKYSTRIYLCTPGYFIPIKYGRSCVATKVGVPLVPPPADACTSNPCQNGAKCTSSISMDYNTRKYKSNWRCTCAKGFMLGQARNCAAKWTDSCLSSPCENGGTCTSNTYSLSYRCSCPKHLTAEDADATKLVGGTNCATAFNDPCTSSPCQNGATCTPYVSTYSSATNPPTTNCRCTVGYTGQHCEYQRAPATAICPGSPLQMCKMICPQTSCPAGQCLMRTGNCCSTQCKPLKCSRGSCCFQNGARPGKAAQFCACRDSATCKSTSCLVGPPAGFKCKAAAAGKTCTAAQTAMGMKATSCGSACPSTCGQQREFCSQVCVLDCQCPKGNFYDPKKSKCVTSSSQCTVPPPPPIMMDGPMDGGMMMDGMTMNGR